MPIAIYIRMDDFINHEIRLKKGDSIYLFSDGYIDQFGGNKEKRYMNKRFKNLLLENANISMIKQQEVLISEFENWKGDNCQIDDITILGLKM
jgi:serine phosphatase RsbU (regulator of sigma subunit)